MTPCYLRIFHIFIKRRLQLLYEQESLNRFFLFKSQCHKSHFLTYPGTFTRLELYAFEPKRCTVARTRPAIAGDPRLNLPQLTVPLWRPRRPRAIADYGLDRMEAGYLFSFRNGVVEKHAWADVLMTLKASRRTLFTNHHGELPLFLFIK